MGAKKNVFIIGATNRPGKLFYIEIYFRISVLFTKSVNKLKLFDI